jgi:uncharacterized damage-inducible protein DinB
MSGSFDRNGLLALQAYNAYANQLMFQTIEKMSPEEFVQPASPSHGSVRGLLSHMLECEAFFLASCQGQSIELSPDDFSTLPDIRQYRRQLEAEQLAFIQSLDAAGAEREISVQLGSHPLVFPVWQLLAQALIHSIHHRGELSIVLTELGRPLPTLDIILQFIEQSGQKWLAE